MVIDLFGGDRVLTLDGLELKLKGSNFIYNGNITDTLHFWQMVMEPFNS